MQLLTNSVTGLVFVDTKICPEKIQRRRQKQTGCYRICQADLKAGMYAMRQGLWSLTLR